MLVNSQITKTRDLRESPLSQERPGKISIDSFKIYLYPGCLVTDDVKSDYVSYKKTSVTKSN